MSSQQVAQNVPSTKQAVTGIDKAQEYLAERASGQGAGAEKTVSDINQALKDAKTLVQDKDLGDSVSKLVLDASAVGNQVSQNAPSAQNLRGAAADAKANLVGNANVDTNQVSRDAHEAANQVRRIAQLTVTSPAFRRFLWNYYTVLRDSFGPQVDQAVEQRLKEGRKDDLTRKAERKAYELKQQANQQQGQAQAKRNEVAGTAQNAAQAAQQGDAKTAISQTRDKAQQLTSQAKQTLDQQLPKEQREELIQRWKSLQREVQDDPNLRSAIEDLKATVARLRDDVQPLVDQATQKANELKQVAREKGQEAKNQVQTQASNADTTGLQRVFQDARELLEKFANGQSLQPLIETSRKWAFAIKDDQQLRNWANDAYQFVLVTKNDANKLNDDQHLQQLNNIIDRGRALTQGKHKQIADNILNESRDFLYALRNDAASNRLRQSLNRVVEDLFVDRSGRFVIKPDVYKQLANALSPSFGDLFRDVRIAHIEEHNDDMDFALDNILIDASDIQPNQLDVTSIADLSLGKQDTGADLRFRISANGICPKINNTYFRYERHTFPKLSDFGSLDAALTGKGLSFNLDIEYCANAKDNTNNSTFRLKDVSVDMQGLKLDFHNASHETLYKIFKPLIVKKVTKQIENTIKEQLQDYVEQFDEAATDIRYRALETVENSAGDRIVRGTDNNVGQSGVQRL